MYLQRILKERFLRWANAGAAERIVVAHEQMNSASVPAGVEVVPHKMIGERIIVKAGRVYGNTRLVSARWPEANMHETENHYLVSVIEGQGQFGVGNYQLGCREGDFILIPPGIPFPSYPGSQRIVSAIPGRHFVLLWMVLYRRGFQCWLTRYDDRANFFRQPTDNYLFLNGQVIELFRLLTDEASGEKNTSLCNGLLLAFFSALQREVDALHYLHPSLAARPETLLPDTQDFSGHLRSYIEQHLHQPLTVAQMARGLFMSRAQFTRRMRQETGQSFVEFLTEYRINEAKILLSQSEWTVQVISEFLGFKSPTYFHALFCRQVGCTPGEFRLQDSKNHSKKEAVSRKKSLESKGDV